MTWSRHRLRRGDDFRVVTRRGTRAARSHVVVHLAPLPGGDGAPRVGFVVSKKIGNAVVRNRVTRRLREIIRSELAELPTDSAVVIRTMPGIDQVPFEELRHQVVGALRRAAERLAERSVDSSGRTANSKGSPSAGADRAPRAAADGQAGR